MSPSPFRQFFKASTLSCFLFTSTSHGILVDFGDVSTPNLVSGTAKTPGAVYRYSNVGTEGGTALDALLTLGSTNGGASYSHSNPSIEPVGTTAVTPAGDNAMLIANTYARNQLSFLEFNLKLVESGTLNGFAVTSLDLAFSDIDSSNSNPGGDPNRGNFSDMVLLDPAAGGSYFTSGTSMLIQSSQSGIDVSNYDAFHLDNSVELTEIGGIDDNDPLQVDHTVIVNFATLGTDGFNFGYGTIPGLDVDGLSSTGARRGLLDGSGTTAVPEASSTVLIAAILAMGYATSRRRR